jgi:VanZ family protein
VKLPHAILVAVYCAFLFWMSSGPVEVPETIQFDQVDKVAHMSVYAVLCALVFHGLRRSGRSWTPRALFWIPVLFSSLYGVTDEFHQYFVATRTCDIVDWMADTAGALLAATILSLFIRFFGKPAPETLTPCGD